MAKSKLNLDELKVQSFVTTLEHAQMTQLKGGAYAIRGRRYSYRARWTSVDTRSNNEPQADTTIQRSGAQYGGPREW
jgi:hypothetical protein